MNNILDIFYKEIIPQALTGRVDCYFMMNILFNVKLEGKIYEGNVNYDDNGIMIPYLQINNKEYFDNLLIAYVQKALDFYDKKDFTFILDEQELNAQEKMKYLIKYIICALFANATYEDFENPIAFLQSRLQMMDNHLLENINEDVNLGFLSSINANLHVMESISPIKAETPYRLHGYLEFNDGYKLFLPEVYEGKTDNYHMVYGMQQTIKKSQEEDYGYIKQIRKGLISKVNGAPEHYFLMMMTYLALCNKEDIKAVSFLLPRWNAKRIAISRFLTMDNGENIVLEKFKKQEEIQNNMTDVFMRYFQRINDVSDGFEIEDVPFETDSNLHVKISDDFISRAQVFNEIFALAKEYKNNEVYTK